MDEDDFPSLGDVMSMSVITLDESLGMFVGSSSDSVTIDDDAVTSRSPESPVNVRFQVITRFV